MHTTIDAAGRLVIPKKLRDRMELRAGSLVDIQFVGDHLEIAVPPLSVSLVDHGLGPVAVPDEDVPELTADTVRRTLEKERR